MLKSLRIVAAGALVAFATYAPTVARTATRPEGVVFQSPSGRAPAGATSLADPFSRVLPSGRFVHPTGTNVVVGMDAQGLALTPSGRFAIVSLDGDLGAGIASQLDPATTGGSSLAVIDTVTMAVVSRYSDPGETFFAGVVALPDPLDVTNTLVFASGGKSNAVYVLDLDSAGNLRRDAQHAIDVHGFPGTLVANATGSRVFVVDNVGDDVAQIDPATRTLAGTSVPVGFAPFGAASSDEGLLVANEGLMTYQPTGGTAAPPFATVAPDLARASSVSIIPQYADGTTGQAVSAYAPLDRTPDGIREIGGAQPAAIVAMHDRPFAFVAMSNVDRIATISLAGGAPAVAGGTELRLYNRGPYGTEPVALALAKSERRLYVALAGIDAIAVLDTSDPAHLHRVGLIPTGWYPSALALSRDGRYLFVANAKGLAHDRAFTGDQATGFDAKGRVTAIREDASTVWSTLERIDLTQVDLRRSTPLALSYLRSIAPAKNGALVPQHFGTVGSAKIRHVVFIMQEGKTYDSVLGDLTGADGAPYGPGDPNYVAYDASVTPNLHALARTFGLAGNMYADADEPGTGDQFAAGGIASSYTQKVAPSRGNAQDPEDYPRSGYIFNSLALRGKTYREYGDLLRVSGYDDGTAPDPKTDDPAYAVGAEATAATTGLGGIYSLDAPAPLVLAGHVDLTYPGWNVRIRDVRRAQEFVRDFDTYVKSDTVPAFTYVYLPPSRRLAGTSALDDSVADGDRALGTIVEYLTHMPQWSSTAIFITPSDSFGTRDHVDVSRTYAIVVSPYAKRRFVGMRHLSTASVLKTEEEILGLPALSLGDALASDLGDFFTPHADVTPFDRVDMP